MLLYMGLPSFMGFSKHGSNYIAISSKPCRDMGGYKTIAISWVGRAASQSWQSWHLDPFTILPLALGLNAIGVHL